MATYVPAKNATALIFYGALRSQADSTVFKTTPTLAAGDFLISKDGAATANLGTLPTNTPGNAYIKFSLSGTEMTADNAAILCHDVAGAEWMDAFFNVPTSARQVDDLAYPATSGRSMVVDASGLVDANTVKIGPTGAGTAQTARDVGLSVLLSAGTGTGQLDFTSGVVKANATQILGTAVSTPATAGILDVNVKNMNNVSGSAITTVKAVQGLTTADTITTVTTVTNQLTAAAIATGVWQDTTAGDFTVASSIGKSLYTTGNAPGAASGIAIVGSNMGTVSSVTGAVGSVTGNVGGNVVGSVASVTATVNADMKKINGTTVNGDGAGTPWGP